jgi:hypothetical protein
MNATCSRIIRVSTSAALTSIVQPEYNRRLSAAQAPAQSPTCTRLSAGEGDAMALLEDTFRIRERGSTVGREGALGVSRDLRSARSALRVRAAHGLRSL